MERGSTMRLLFVLLSMACCQLTGAMAHPGLFPPIPGCSMDWHNRPAAADGERDQSGPALGALLEACPRQPLLCCIRHTVNDVQDMVAASNVTQILDSFFTNQLHTLHDLLSGNLYGIGDILVRTIPQELPMLEPIELNLVRPNIQETFCRASNEFAQDVDEPLCHPTGAETKAKANFILAGAYTSAALTVMGYPGRLLTQQKERCVRAYTTRSYRSYTRHVEALACALRSLQCRIKPALLALQSTAELFDRIRLLINSPQFPGPRCKGAIIALKVCPHCAGQQVIPPCLSSCNDVLQVCLSEVMNDQLDEVFLPVVKDAAERFATVLTSTVANLEVARGTIRDIILEAHRDVMDRDTIQDFKAEINGACGLDNHMTERYEPHRCNQGDSLVDYEQVLRKALAASQILVNSFGNLDRHYASQLCPKSAVPPGMLPSCTEHAQQWRAADEHSERSQRLQENTKGIMDLFLSRNNHLFDHVPTAELRMLYDDEDSQGSYLDISEGGSGRSSGSASGAVEISSGSGSGETPVQPMTTRPVIKKFTPEVCGARIATPQSGATLATTVMPRTQTDKQHSQTTVPQSSTQGTTQTILGERDMDNGAVTPSEVPLEPRSGPAEPINPTEGSESNNLAGGKPQPNGSSANSISSSPTFFNLLLLLAALLLSA